MGIFDSFFAQKEEQLDVQVDFLFQEYFKAVFEDSPTAGFVDKATLTTLISEKFVGDDLLQDQLNTQLAKFESPEAGERTAISEAAVKLALRQIMKTHIKALTEQREDQEALIEELQQTTSGGYARQMIQRNIQSYKESGITTDPLNDIKDLLDLFYGDEQVNNQMTMVCGTDLCEMLGLFHDLAEAVNELNAKKISELEKYKIAYNNRVRRDKRKEEEEKQVTKSQNLEDEEKFSVIRKQNTELLM